MYGIGSHLYFPMTSLTLPSKSKWAWRCWSTTTHVIQGAIKPATPPAVAFMPELPSPESAPELVPEPLSPTSLLEPAPEFSPLALTSILTTLTCGPDKFIFAPDTVSSNIVEQVTERILFTAQCVMSKLLSFHFDSDSFASVKWYVSKRSDGLTIFVQGLDSGDVLKPVAEMLRVKYTFYARDESRVCTMKCCLPKDGCCCRWDHCDIHMDSPENRMALLKAPVHPCSYGDAAIDLGRVVQGARLILMGANVTKMTMFAHMYTWNVKLLCSTKVSAIQERDSSALPCKIIRIAVSNKRLCDALISYFEESTWGTDSNRAHAKRVSIVRRESADVLASVSDCTCCQSDWSIRLTFFVDVHFFF